MAAFFAGALLAEDFFAGAVAAALLPSARRARDDFEDRWSLLGRLSTTTVMWLVRLRIRNARPCAAGGCAWRSGPRRRRPWPRSRSPGPSRCCSARWRPHWRSPWRPARWRPAAPNAGCRARLKPTCHAPGQLPGAPFSATPARTAPWRSPTGIQWWLSSIPSALSANAHRRLLFRSSLMCPLNVRVGANSPSL